MVHTKSQNRFGTKTQLVNNAWLFAQSLLWQNKTFNQAEVELAKQQIAQIILDESGNASRINYIMFCERVLLASEFLKRNTARFVPHPLKWLSPYFEHGYVGTKNWYLDMQHERQYIVVHRFELKIFAESFLQYTVQPTKENYIKSINALNAYADESLVQQFKNLILTYNFND